MAVAIDAARVAAEIDADAAVEWLRALVRIPGQTGAEQKVAEYVADRLRQLGARVTIDQRWNVLGELGRGPGRGVLLLTHTDSGPAGPMQDPYSGALMDGAAFGKDGPVVYGRGACAPKAALAAMLAALAVLARHEAALPGRVQLAAVTKDLSANHEGIRELDAAGALRVDVCLAGEPSNNEIVLGARGIGHYEVAFEGIPTHWGRPQEGTNPLYALGAYLLAVEHLDLPRDATLGPATLSAIAVDSTAVPPRTPNHCRVVLDRRILPDESPEAIGQALQALSDQVVAARAGITSRVRQISGMFPYSVPATAPIVGTLERASHVALGRSAGHTYITFASNAGYVIRERHMPGVAFGPGRIGDASEREHVAVSQVADAAKIYAAASVLLMEAT